MQYRVIKNNCKKNYMANLKKYHHTLSKIPNGYLGLYYLWGETRKESSNHFGTNLKCKTFPHFLGFARVAFDHPVFA